MSRSGYSDDCDNWDLIRWRGQVASAIRGKRGQAFLRDLLAALDAMPNKRLVSGELEAGGEVCALGCIGRARGIDLQDIDVYDRSGIAKVLNIAEPLAAEIMFENDDDFCYWRLADETEEQYAAKRWQRMRDWVAKRIKADSAAEQGEAK